MKGKDIDILKAILNQYRGPIDLSYQTIAISHITYPLALRYFESIESIEGYSVSDLFSLYHVIEYAIKELGEDEFNTVVGYDLYKDGYKVLNKIHNKMVMLNEVYLEKVN